MSYVAKTDWKHDDPVTEQDLNRWETGIKENNEKLRTVQEFALTTAFGDAKESITNVNTATTVGLFLVGSTATGAPTTAVGLLYVWRRGSSHLLQEYWEISSNKRHHRTSTDNGVTWTTWQTIANTDVATTSKNGLMSSSDKTALDNTQKVKLTQDTGRVILPSNNIDFNTVTVTGFYRFDASLGHTNSPTGGGYWTIIVEEYHSTSGVQIWSSVTTNDVYIRRREGGVWQPFRKLTDNNILGGILLGNKLVDTQTANFVGKVSGSTTVNPHELRRTSSTVLITPAIGSNPPDTEIAKLSSIDNTLTTASTTVNNEMAQYQFSFNLIAHVERAYGTIPGASTVEKAGWLKANISKMIPNWYGYGSSPGGSKASFTEYLADTSQWAVQVNSTYAVSHTSNSVYKLTKNLSASKTIDNNGFIHFLAFSDPSDGVTSSVLNTDYVELQIELSTSLKDNMKPVWIDATLQNGWVAFDSSQTPRYAIDLSGIVHLNGSVKLGTFGTGTPVMTLPTGFRPLNTVWAPLIAGTSTDKVVTARVNSSGQLSLIAQGTVDNTLVSLANLRFPTN